jgi:hypothetical protein
VPSSATFQTLWHEVTIDGSGAAVAERLAAIVPPTWPMPAEGSSRYRLESIDGRCTVWQGEDVLVVARDVESAWHALTDRIGARSLELAARRGWTPVRGTVLSGAQGRVCLVGSTPQRVAAAARLATAGAALESHDAWITRDGEVLAVPFAGARDVPELVIARPDEVAVRLPESPDHTGTAAAVAVLVAAADGSVRPPAQVVRDLSALLSGPVKGVPAYRAQLGGGWYFP